LLIHLYGLICDCLKAKRPKHRFRALRRAGNDRFIAGLMSSLQSSVDQSLFQFSPKNTPLNTFLVAMNSAMEASPYILVTSRSVLTFGGFAGSDDVVSVSRLAQCVKDRKLRFVVVDTQMEENKSEIYTWIRKNCKVVNLAGSSMESADKQPAFGVLPGPGGSQQSSDLFDCTP